MTTSGKPPLTSSAATIAVGVDPDGPAGGSNPSVKRPAATPKKTRNVFVSPPVTVRSAWPSWLKSASAIPVGVEVSDRHGDWSADARRESKGRACHLSEDGISVRVNASQKN